LKKIKLEFWLVGFIINELGNLLVFDKNNKKNDNTSNYSNMKSPKIAQQRLINRADRELLVNVNMFLLGDESLKGLFWNVAEIGYNPATKSLKIAITTTDNKLGTTLEKMRKKAKYLAEYLYDAGAIYCRPRIYFSVFSKNEEELRVAEFLETVNANV
jgi:hypothetical protein